ncbi:hypothetical protein FJR48_06305 [Sulfurimonas lithotrophica]|uniref:Uncharacterized protein n=1 Tax=Sulfurimonas lithotrophica TaxID=2590022 RepID=A0A5P8P0X0_9BACT|nr:hypothetical protein [Sulfurimonas lithotrophica]QFR49358.1 hypothetical protein FJR48_06305 [Sulfurimonas lithotrophica]
MIKIILLFLLPLSIYASKILSYNVYDRTDRVDIMITFDVPYNGTIKKSRTTSKIIIKLQDASIESSKLKQISSKYIKTLAITPLEGYVQLIASVSENITLKVSKTADAYGLRLRFQKAGLVTKTNTSNTKSITTDSNSNLSYLPTKKTDDMTQSYYIVIAILIIGIIILFYIKKRVTPKNNNTKQQDANKITTNPLKHQDHEVSIRFQKNIDEKNSVVMLDFIDQSYLVMMGSNNVLLDRFQDDKPASQEEFNIILQDHQQMLENFLNNQDLQSETNVKSYSQKASSISYDV